MLGAAAAVIVAAAVAACSSAALGSPSLAIPSVNASAAASLGAQVALSALDRADTAIATAQTSGGLSAENATSLKSLSGSVRTALQSGDMTAAKSAFDQFSAKVNEVAPSLTGDSGKAVQDAVAAVKAALGSRAPLQRSSSIGPGRVDIAAAPYLRARSDRGQWLRVLIRIGQRRPSLC